MTLRSASAGSAAIVLCTSLQEHDDLFRAFRVFRVFVVLFAALIESADD